MNRFLCIWLPAWPLQRLAVGRPELRQQGAVLYEQVRGVLRVVACSAAARRQGISPGMPLAEALARKGRSSATTAAGPHPASGTARSPDPTPSAFQLLPADPLADRVGLLQLAEWCQQFSPTVGLEEAERPESLLLDVTGLGKLFGGEELLVARISEAFAQRGLLARIALADTLGAAWALAHGPRIPRDAASSAHVVDRKITCHCIVPPGETAAALRSLPLACLRLPEETVLLLAELGLRRVGQLAVLPRESLTSRFGPDLLRRLDQSVGAAPEVIISHAPPPEFLAEWSFEAPTDRHEPIEQALEALLRRVLAALAQRNEGVTQLQCRFDCPGHAAAYLAFGLFRASSCLKHLWDLVRLHLESLKLPGSVSSLRVEAIAFAPLASRQRELFGGETDRDHPHELAMLIDRLSSRLGREAVVRPGLVSQAQPEYAAVDLPLANTAVPRGVARRSAGKRGQVKLAEQAAADLQAGTRPLWLFSAPLPLEAVLRPSESPGRSGCWTTSPPAPGEQPLAAFRLEGVLHYCLRCAGPERIETGWWRGSGARRDYYRVDTDRGSRWWLFRRLQDGAWFLHGEFA